MRLAIARRLGHYEILGPLGMGGMGEVYRARDTRLRREVAIKVLPAERMGDERGRRRFLQEAQAASALNHPNIVTIHEIESADEIDFIVMEYVRGYTLKGLIPKRGMPPRQALRLAIPIADALICAHAHHIVHRDLKPGNVVVSHEGVVKVVDFGLAKRVSNDPEPGAETLTEAGREPPTRPGVATGTVGYMSPEQATGGEVDARSDIFSFGTVLYEMLTGERAFPGKTASDTLAAVIRDEPRPPRELAPGIPEALERIILRCLRKEPARRFQHVTDLKVELLEVNETSDSGREGQGFKGTSETPPEGARPVASGADRFDSWTEIAAHLGRSVSTVQRWEKQEGLPVYRHPHSKVDTVYAYRSEIDAWWRDRRSRLESSGESNRWERLRRPWGMAVVLLVVLGVAAGIALRTLRGHRPAAETARPLRLTSLEGAELDPALSRDGETLAFVWGGEGDGSFDLYLQTLGGAAPRRLTGSGSVCCPTWSPDGRFLAFVRLAEAEGTVFTIPATGGPERRLATLHPWFGLSLAWSLDGRLVYPDRSSPTEPYALTALAVDTLQTQAVTRPDPGYLGDAFPTWSPDGRTLAFTRVSASGDALPSDVYLTREGLGEPRRLTFDNVIIGGLDWSADGRDLLYTGVRKGEDPRIWRVSVEGNGRKPTPVAVPALIEIVAETASAVSHDLRLAVSRRSGRIAYVRGSYDTDIWRTANPLLGESGPPERLIASTMPDEAPQYSPDGRTIAYATSRSGHGEVWTCHRDGSGCAPLTHTGVHSGTPRFSPDGRQIAFDSRPEGQSDVFVFDLASRQTRRVTTAPADDVVPSWSADGRTLYFASNRTGSWEVWKTDVRDGSSSALTSQGGFAAFERGDAVYFTRHDSPGLWRVARTGGSVTRVSSGPQCWGHWAMGRDGVYFLDRGVAGRTSLEFLRFGAEAPVRAGSLVFAAPCAESSLAVSPDGREVLYVAAEKASDVMMVDLPR